MRKLFSFVESGIAVGPPEDTSRLCSLIQNCTVVVRANTAVGAGVLLGEQIITSWFLVAQDTIVSVLLPYGKKQPAFVVSRDQDRNLAKLKLADIGTCSNHKGHGARSFKRGVSMVAGTPNAIGDPLLVANTKMGTPKVCVGAMRYATNVCERRTDTWRLQSDTPRGILGSGVWTLEGRLKGVALCAQVTPSLELRQIGHAGIGGTYVESDDRPYVYALPVEEVMEFVETK